MSTVTTGAGAASAPLDPPAGFQPEQPKSLLRYAKYLDPFMLFLWVISTSMPFAGMTPLRYALAGYFTAAMFLFARQTMPAAVRSWPLFILPVLCFISMLWSFSPDSALRYSIQLVMTALVAIYMATRISGRHILLAYFAAELLAVLLCLRSPNIIQGAWTGFFGQKNFYAIHMFIFYMSAFGVALDRENRRWIRLFAGAMIPLGGFMVLMAKSGTTTLMLVGATAIIMGQILIWRPAMRIRHGRLLITLLLAVLVLFTSLLVFGLSSGDVNIMADVLGALGKDTTLTGRTALWEMAKHEMAEHPWTGLGLDGFWRQENGLAHNLLSQDGLKFTGSYTFHNSYYENGVTYGYPGFYATMFLAAWTLSSATLTWLRKQSATNTVFLVIAAMVIVRSFSEADLGGVFSNTVVLLFTAAARKEFDKPKSVISWSAMTPRIRP